jgi:flagellum-specific ATP synthase
VMHSIVSPEHLSQARLLKSLFAKYQRNKDLVAVGAYVAGSDPMLDRAIALYPRIEEFLQQGMLEQSEFEPSQQALQQLLS